MKLSDNELEARLRRTFAAVVDRPLDEPQVTDIATRRRRPVVFSLAAAAAAVAAVVGVAVLDRGEPATTVASQPPDGRTFADFVPSPAEAELLFRAEQRLTRLCMEAAGHPYPEAPSGANSLDPDWSRLGRTDPARAQREGYLLPGNELGGRNAAMDSLADQEAWTLALTGEPSSGRGGSTGPRVPIVDPVTGEENGSQAAGGCFGQMERKLYVDQSRHTSLHGWVANHVRNEVERHVVEDARFKAAIGSWSSCMKQVGYDYKDPFGPVNEFNAEDGRTAGRPTSKELAVARADLECKDVTGLTRTYRALLDEHGRTAAATYRRWLVEYRQLVDQALATARTVLEG